MAAVLILSIDPVCSHFIPHMIEHDRDGSVLNTGVNRMTKQRLHDLRARRSRDVPVLRRTPEKCVAHASAHSVGIVAFLLQTVDNLIHMFR